MYNQMSIFDFINIDKDKDVYQFCNNDNINNLIDTIKSEIDSIRIYLPTIKKVDIKYETWSHVPYLGQRLSVWYYFDCDYNTNPNNYCRVGVEKMNKLIDYEKLINKAIEFNLELSISILPNAIFFSTIELKSKKKVNFKEEENEESV